MRTRCFIYDSHTLIHLVMNPIVQHHITNSTASNRHRATMATPGGVCRCICVVLSLFFCFIHCFAPLFRHHSHVCCRSIVSPQRACYRASERDIRPHALHVFCRSFVSPLRACKLSCHRDGHSTMTHVNFYSVGGINGP